MFKSSMECFYSNNCDKIIQKTNAWNKNNLEKVKLYEKKYSETNVEKRNFRNKQRRQSDVNFRSINKTMCQLYHAMNGLSESSPTVDILGTDIDI